MAVQSDTAMAEEVAVQNNTAMGAEEVSLEEVNELLSHFPDAHELELWLMETSGGADRTAVFLRRLLQMNPAYGQFLAVDEELAGLVRMFAKRFRRAALSGRQPVPMNAFYKPLCEVIWRAVAHVFRSFVDESGESCIPVPKEAKEAQGQVKMLLESNLVLSSKLRESRRAYLRELTKHRDRNRRFTANQQRVLRSLRDDPVMFYEPLESILDETTKEFVRDIVEERIKLEMRTVYADADEAGAQMAELVKDLESDVLRLRAENMRFQNTIAEHIEEKARIEDESGKLQAECEESVKVAKEAQEKLGEAQHKLQSAEAEISEKEIRLAYLEEVAMRPAFVHAEPQGDDASLEDGGGTTRDSSEGAGGNDRRRFAARRQVGAAAVGRAVAAVGRVAGGRIAGRRVGGRVVGELEGASGESDEDGTSRRLEEEIQGLKASLAEQQEASTKAQEVRHKLERAVEEAKAEGYRLAAEAARVAERDAELSGLRAKLATTEAALSRLQKNPSAQPAPAPPAASTPPVAVKPDAAKNPDTQVAKDSEEGSDDSDRWKAKFEDLEEKYDELDTEYAKLEQQVQMLVDKLKETAGEEVVAETLRDIKLASLPPRKKGKKNLKAFERLYEDAQRRASLIRQAKEKEVAAEKEQKSLAAVRAMVHLQRAAKITNSRFLEALAQAKAGAVNGQRPDEVRSGSPDKEDNTGNTVDNTSKPRKSVAAVTSLLEKKTTKIGGPRFLDVLKEARAKRARAAGAENSPIAGATSEEEVTTAEPEPEMQSSPPQPPTPPTASASPESTSSVPWKHELQVPPLPGPVPAVLGPPPWRRQPPQPPLSADAAASQAAHQQTSFNGAGNRHSASAVFPSGFGVSQVAAPWRKPQLGSMASPGSTTESWHSMPPALDLDSGQPLGLPRLSAASSGGSSRLGVEPFMPGRVSSGNSSRGAPAPQKLTGGFTAAGLGARSAPVLPAVSAPSRPEEPGSSGWDVLQKQTSKRGQDAYLPKVFG